MHSLGLKLVFLIAIFVAVHAYDGFLDGSNANVTAVINEGGSYPIVAGGAYPVVHGGTYPVVHGGAYPVVHGGAYPVVAGGAVPVVGIASSPPSGTIVSEAKVSNGGISGILQKTAGLEVGDHGVVPLIANFFGLHPNRKVKKVVSFDGK